MAKLWARLRLAWSVLRNPRQLIPIERIDAAEPPIGPLHSVVRFRNRVESPLYVGRNAQQAAQVFRSHRDNNESVIYRVNGSIRDQHTPR